MTECRRAASRHGSVLGLSPSVTDRSRSQLSDRSGSGNACYSDQTPNIALFSQSGGNVGFFVRAGLNLNGQDEYNNSFELLKNNILKNNIQKLVN